VPSFLQIVNGFPRQVSVSGQDIYDQSISIVASGGTAPSSVNGPVTAGTALTLPASFSYTLNAESVANINIDLNGQRLEQVYDWTTSGSGPNYTAIQFTFQLVVGDRIDIRSERTS
jgi:hypothetical protein